MNGSPSLLLVEDNDGHSYLIEEKFRDAFPDANIVRARNLKEAADALPSQPWDLAIVNDKLPDGSASDFVDKLSTVQPFAAVAVLTEETRDIGMEFSAHHGAVEVLTKDRSTLESFVARIKRLMAASQRINRLLHEGDDGALGMLFRDPLTGVYNRAYFDESLRREVFRCNRYGQDMGILLVDVDGFMEMVKKRGNPAGEKCLKKLAAFLTKCVRSGDIVARYGEDQFAVLLNHCRRADAARCAKRVLQAIREQKASGAFTVSIGALHHSGNSKIHRPQQLVAQATKALHRAKTQGGARLYIAA
ncbi:MAG TPA: diguanylate cyclase response regulator [bacterium]|nr:diguanylate cyclase response regulator [bacterium]